MELTVGCTTRPLSSLPFEEAFDRIAAAGYTDVAVFANAGQVPVMSDTTPEEVAEVKKAAADAGVAPSMLIGRTQLNLGLDAAVDDYKRLIDNTAALGTTWLLDCGTNKEEHYEDYFELMPDMPAQPGEDLGLPCRDSCDAHHQSAAGSHYSGRICGTGRSAPALCHAAQMSRTGIRRWRIPVDIAGPFASSARGFAGSREDCRTELERFAASCWH